MADGFSNLTKRMLEDREAQAAEFERQQKVLEGMKKQLEESGMQAEDNKEYNKRKEKLDKKQYKFRLKGATSPSARKKIKQDEKARQKKEQGLLGKIAKSTSGMFGNMKQRIKGAGKGIMNMLKGTLVAGVLLAVVAFLESPYWEKLKGFIVDTVVPALKKIWEWLKLLFSDPVQALKDLFFGLLEGAKTLGTWLWNKAIKPFWDWIVTIFKETDWGALWDSLWDKAKSIGSWIWNKAILPFWDWIKNIFATTDWGALWEKAVGAYATVMDIIWSPVKKAIAWVLRKFGWDDAAESVESFSIKGFILGIFGRIKCWFIDLFSWGKKAGATEEGGWSLKIAILAVFGKVKEWIKRLFAWGDSDETVEGEEKGWSIRSVVTGVIKTIVGWVGDLFTFDGTKAGTAAGIINILYWLPNMVIKGVLAAGEWLLRLFGFDESADAVGKASKGFNLGEMIVCAAIAAWDWLKEKLTFKIPKLNLPDIGLELKGRAAGMIAYAKAALNPLKSSSEAYTEAYNAVVGGGQPPDVAEYTPDEPPLSAKEQEEKRQAERLASIAELGEEGHEAKKREEVFKYYPEQHGGAFSGLNPLLVGEKGPEMIFPSGAGQVMNAQRTSAMMNSALQRRMDGMGGGGAQAIIAPTTVANTQSTNITNTSTTLVNNDPIVSTVNKAA